MPRWSLAARIGALFALVTTVVFGVAGVHLYRAVSQQLDMHDDQMLLGTVSYLRRRVAEIAGIEAVRMDPHRLLDVVAERGMLLAIRDAQGQPLTASAPEAVSLFATAPVSLDRDPEIAQIGDWRGPGGQRGRMLSAWAQFGKPPHELVQLIVVRDLQESDAMLLKHRNHVLLALLLGVLVSTGLGYGIARRGLRPVKMVARAAGDITVNQLGERLNIKDAPAELVEMVEAFNRMLDGLEDAFRRLTQFSSDIAHDLRTPISNLRIATDVALARQRTTAEYEALLASNIEEYERLNRMIENMLFLARAENAEVALNRQDVAVDVELKRIGEYFEGTADEQGVTIDVAAAGTVWADAILLRRAVSNLVANAIRHSPRGERVLMTGRKLVAGGFVIEVSNRGSAISLEQQSKIFDRFYRGDNARSQSQSSSGLGLAIVKSIMKLHGGTVSVESVAGGLTTFSLIFPEPV